MATARRGKFGRTPRPAPSLTATLISIAREEETKRAQNIMSAWQSGGLFEGKKATDSAVLSFWHDKLRGLDPNDPLTNEYKINISQLEYSIAKSKATLAYAQSEHKAADDQKMASFFLNWANKVPRNSEFWRDLERDGAQFIESVKSKNKAGENAAKELAYQNALSNAGKDARAGNFILQVLEGVANVHGLLGSADTKGLTNLSDPGELVSLVQQIGQNPRDPIFDWNGQRWTGQMVIDQLKKFGVSGDDVRGGRYGFGTLTLDNIQRALVKAHGSLMKQFDIAIKTGHKTDANAIMKSASSVTDSIREIKVLGVTPVYNNIIAQRDAVLNNPNATSEDKRKAGEEAARQLGSLAAVQGLDLRSVDTLRNEALTNIGQGNTDRATFGEDYLGTKTQAPQNEQTATTDQSKVGSAARIFNLMGTLQEEHLQISQLPESSINPTGFVYAQGTRDAQTGAFTFDPTGKDIGVVPAETVSRSASSFTTVMVPSGDGSALPLTVVGQPITAIAHDANGNVLRSGVAVNGIIQDRPDTIGTVFKYNIGGQEVRVYQLPDGKGGLIYTTAPPWATSAHEVDQRNGSIQVDISGLAGGRSQGLPNQTTGAPGTQYIDPAVAISATRNAAGRNDITDFDTALMATLHATPEARIVASALARDPIFRDQLYEQEVQAANGDRGRLDAIMAKDSNTIVGVSMGTASQTPSFNSPDPAFTASQTPGRPDITPIGSPLAVLQNPANRVPNPVMYSSGAQPTPVSSAAEGLRLPEIRDQRAGYGSVSTPAAYELKVPSVPAVPFSTSVAKPAGISGGFSTSVTGTPTPVPTPQPGTTPTPVPTPPAAAVNQFGQVYAPGTKPSRGV